MATREIVVFYGPIPLDPTKKYDSAIMEAAFPQNGLLAAWEELKASGLIGNRSIKPEQIIDYEKIFFGFNSISFLSIT
jgi:hypothetical protein